MTAHSSRCAVWASRVLGGVLLIALIAASACCAALVIALASSMPMQPVFSGAAKVLVVDPPCLTESPPLLALPGPVRCKWNWLRMGCAAHCELKLKWLPLPHPKCLPIPY